MAWDEGWLRSDRPSASELPGYTLLPDSRAKKIFGFYVVWFVVVGILLQTLGMSGTAYVGIPVLIWITLAANFSSVAVLYFWVYVPERNQLREGGEGR